MLKNIEKFPIRGKNFFLTYENTNISLEETIEAVKNWNFSIKYLLTFQEYFRKNSYNTIQKIYLKAIREPCITRTYVYVEFEQEIKILKPDRLDLFFNGDKMQANYQIVISPVPFKENIHQTVPLTKEIKNIEKINRKRGRISKNENKIKIKENKNKEILINYCKRIETENLNEVLNDMRLSSSVTIKEYLNLRKIIIEHDQYIKLKQAEFNIKSFDSSKILPKVKKCLENISLNKTIWIETEKVVPELETYIKYELFKKRVENKKSSLKDTIFCANNISELKNLETTYSAVLLYCLQSNSKDITPTNLLRLTNRNGCEIYISHGKVFLGPKKYLVIVAEIGLYAKMCEEFLEKEKKQFKSQIEYLKVKTLFVKTNNNLIIDSNLNSNKLTMNDINIHETFFSRNKNENRLNTNNIDEIIADNNNFIINYKKDNLYYDDDDDDDDDNLTK